jgi:Sulfotransferase family
MGILCILGVERTGSSRTATLLSGFEHLLVKEEIFHPNAAHTMDDEWRELGPYAGIADVTGIRDRRLVSWMRNHPNQALDWLVHRAGGRTVVLKLFPGHIESRDELERLFSRSDIAFLITRRRPIDCYISALKAQRIGKWRNADTTSVKVEGSVGQFLSMLTRATIWYAACADRIAAASRPHVDLSYEGEIAKPDNVLLPALVAKLRLLGIDPGRYSTAARVVPLQQQDRGTDYEAKMSNWQEFNAALRARPEYFAAFLE